MARFLFTLWPMDTHIRPGLAVAESLRKQGHEALFFTGTQFCPQVKAEGFECFPFQMLEAARVDRLLHALMEHWNKPWRTRKLWREFLVDTIPAQLQDLRALLEAQPVDVIVCDMAMWGPMLVLAETDRIPVAVLSHVGYCMLPGRSGVHPGVPVGLRSSAFAKMYARAASKLIKLGTLGIQRGASNLRVSCGLPPLDTTVVEHTGTMPLYLVPSDAELDYGRDDLPGTVHYVGAYQAAPEAALSQATETHTPHVLVVEGTNHVSDPWLFKTAAAGLAAGPFTTMAVAGLDRVRQETEMKAIFSPFRSASLREQEELIAAADVVVTGGSSEVVLAALSRGIPLVLLPLVLEEAAMTRRVADYGAGLSLQARRCTPANLRSAVERVLTEESFRRQARKIAENFRRCGGSDRAALLLDDLASRYRPVVQTA